MKSKSKQNSELPYFLSEVGCNGMMAYKNRWGGITLTPPYLLYIINVYVRS